jgi:hypothetical protein
VRVWAVVCVEKVLGHRCINTEREVTALSELNDIRENIFRDEETRHFLSWNCVVTLSTAERSFCDNLCLTKRK